MIRFLVFLSFFASLTADEKLIAFKDVEGEKRFVNRVWKGYGIVVIGKIKNHKNYQIASRIPIRKDGSFCTALYRSRELVFLSHGYEALVAADNKLVKDTLDQKVPGEVSVVDVGEIEFKKPQGENFRTLKGKITLKESPSKDHEVTLSLLVLNNKYLWSDHGNEGGAVLRRLALQTKVKSGESFQFEKLPKIPYLLKIESPGYVTQYTDFDEKFTGDVHFGNMLVFPAPSLEISYRARVRKNGGKWIEDKKDSKTKIDCNGESDFLFSKLKDGLGNGLDLRIRPDDDGVKASFFYLQRNSFYNLGKVDLKDLNWDVNLQGLQGDTKAYLQKGNTYFFTIDSINKTQIQLLFKVEE